MKRILKTKEITSKQQLIDEVKEIWESFPQESIDRLVQSFKGRLYATISNNGESLSDILRNGIQIEQETEVTPNETTLDLADIITTYDPNVDDNPIEMRTQRNWSIEEDILLLSSVKELGHKWSKIAKKFVDRTANSVRNRFKHIYKN